MYMYEGRSYTSIGQFQRKVDMTTQISKLLLLNEFILKWKLEDWGFQKYIGIQKIFMFTHLLMHE